MQKYDLLIACEFSGAVRDAFIAHGVNAVSCDLLPSEKPGPHIQGDAVELAHSGTFKGMIAHPPCTYLCNSGVRHLYTDTGLNADRYEKMQHAAQFFKALYSAPIQFRAIENPVMHHHGLDIIGARATQFIQPWEHGHPESKRTGLWLVNFPPLVPSDDVYASMMRLPVNQRNRVHHMAPGPERWRERSRTYPGIAAAMAAQWSRFLTDC